MPKPRFKYTDQTPLPWGKHKGIPMGQVDPAYLLWLFRQKWIRDWPDLHAYLVENQDVLLLEDTASESNEKHGEFDSYEDYMRHGH